MPRQQQIVLGEVIDQRLPDFRGSRIGDVVLRDMAVEGKIVLHNWIETPTYTGPSKGVHIDLKGMTEEQRQQLIGELQEAIDRLGSVEAGEKAATKKAAKSNSKKKLLAAAR